MTGYQKLILKFLWNYTMKNLQVGNSENESSIFPKTCSLVIALWAIS